MPGRYEIIVIGSGPGGEGAAMKLAKEGKRVAVIEEAPRVGGNCTHRGTIPSKALRQAVQQLTENGARNHVRDVALTAAGQTHLRGGGTAEDENSWMVSAGLDVSVVDERVTSSLKSQALANIMRFSQSIEARRREIFVSTFDPLIRIETLTASRDALIANLGRYENDYQTGVQEYIAGNLNIDNLLIRRQTLFSQQEQIAELTNAIGSNVAELGEATGLFFEMLDENTPKNTMEKS